MGVLDTINTNPTFMDTIPSTGKKIKYRGYTAGEEQTMLVAKESKDFTTILTNIKDVIKACSFDEVDPEELASFDIEYLLLALRAKSVGEEIELTLKCEKCEGQNDAALNIDEVKKVDVPKDGNIIKLNDTVMLIMKWPGFGILEEMSKKDTDIFKIIASLIKQVVHGENVIEASELDPAEVVKFCRKLNSKNIKKISDWVRTTPTINHEHSVKCAHCGHENKYKFMGMNNFFV